MSLYDVKPAVLVNRAFHTKSGSDGCTGAASDGAPSAPTPTAEDEDEGAGAGAGSAAVRMGGRRAPKTVRLKRTKRRAVRLGRARANARPERTRRPDNILQTHAYNFRRE